ncbi:stalk domain-containing protein [Paenibacillus flagellatus]|nr:stalk domain-containing protein [Paenibacillus flagellatus]
MKKFAAGLLCGVALCLGTAGYAEEVREWSRFPVKLKVNDKPASLDDKPIFNYDGSAYVPLRPFAERLGASVSFDAATGTITVMHNESNRPVLRDEDYPSLSVGVAGIGRNGEYKIVDAYLLLDSSDDRIQSERLMQTRVRLHFYDRNDKRLGTSEKLITLGGWADNPFQVVPFQGVVDGDIDSYAYAKLDVVYFGDPIEDFNGGITD